MCNVAGNYNYSLEVGYCFFVKLLPSKFTREVEYMERVWTRHNVK